MTLKPLLACALLTACLGLQAAEPSSTRSASSEGAAIAFSNLSDGDVIPLVYVVRFMISGMGIAPAGVQIENTGHFHLLIDLADHAHVPHDPPVMSEAITVVVAADAPPQTDS